MALVLKRRQGEVIRIEPAGISITVGKVQGHKYGKPSVSLAVVAPAGQTIQREEWISGVDCRHRPAKGAKQ